MTKIQYIKAKKTRHPLSAFFKAFWRLCDSKLTIMIVPHSQSRIINLQTNMLAVCFSGLIIFGLIISFLYMHQKAISGDLQISVLSSQNQETMASFDQLRDENNSLLEKAGKFRSTLSSSLSSLGIDYANDITQSSNVDSDLASIFAINDIENGSTKEAADIRELTDYLEKSTQPVEQIGKMLKSQGALFSEIPNIWPLKGGIGHISMSFGQHIHPITGQWYIHKGMDFSSWRSGDAIVATANGQVVTVTYSPDFGHYVIIKHKYGIYTRYAHMQTVRVKKGQFVSQGQTIGTVGNSGITTGPHLHYEVHIGSDVVDPAKYINVKVSY